MSCDCNDCFACEQKNIPGWVSTHPFPSYSEMCTIINNTFGHEAFKYIAEYDECNHNLLKTIYESNIDEIVSKNIGNLINTKGGFNAMHANFRIFKYCSPFSDSPPEVRVNTFLLDCHWNGIGKWKL
jgi:hypothetical protein